MWWTRANFSDAMGIAVTLFCIAVAILVVFPVLAILGLLGARPIVTAVLRRALSPPSRTRP